MPILESPFPETFARIVQDGIESVTGYPRLGLKGEA